MVQTRWLPVSFELPRHGRVEKRVSATTRDAPVASDGAQLTAAQEKTLEDSCESGGVVPRGGFDPNRMDIFHYALWAHALGLPKEPCLNTDGSPNLTCQQSNPDYHVPTKSSGFGDVGGGDVLITLHAFGFNFNGADITQAGTLMHELGHNHERRHGGEALQRNCKPNYVSVMSYLFQVHGVLKFDAAGSPSSASTFRARC